VAPGPALTMSGSARTAAARLQLLVGVGALVVGGVGVAHTGAPADLGSVPATRAAAGPPADPGPAVGAAAVDRTEVANPLPGTTEAPSRLRLPRLGVDAPVVPVSVAATGLLAVPDDPRTLGWWSGGAAPGGAAGSVVIDGHVDSASKGLGALSQLSHVRPGDEVTVAGRAGRTVGYTVVALRRYAKTALPAAEVFAQDVRPRLVVVTCGGTFDPGTRHYADNVVVYAVPR
jgi:hypothetical protein